MSAVTLRHAFEPFYTTKDRIGTGLGLWICADIVSRYRGRIATRSNDSPGHSGSVFRVFLPLEYFPTNAMSHGVRDLTQSTGHKSCSHCIFGHKSCSSDAELKKLTLS